MQEADPDGWLHAASKEMVSVQRKRGDSVLPRLARPIGISFLLPSTPKKRGERLQELLAAVA